MKTLFATSLFLILSACATLDNLGDKSEIYDIQVPVVVQVTPDIVGKCKIPSYLACFRNNVIYVQGERATYTKTLNISFVSWADLGDKCGRFTGGPSCYADGTIFTSSTYGLNNAYHTGVIGDLLAAAMGIEIGLNRREQLGHEVFHLLGKKDPAYVSGTANLGGL